MLERWFSTLWRILRASSAWFAAAIFGSAAAYDQLIAWFAPNSGCALADVFRLPAWTPLASLCAALIVLLIAVGVGAVRLIHAAEDERGELRKDPRDRITFGELMIRANAAGVLFERIEGRDLADQLRVFRREAEQGSIDGGLVFWGRAEGPTQEYVMGLPLLPLSKDYWLEHGLVFTWPPQERYEMKTWKNRGSGTTAVHRDLHVEEITAMRWLERLTQ